MIFSMLPRFSTAGLLVVGDVMLDRFVQGEAERVSSEAPALVLRCDCEQTCLGGAASVAGMVFWLGARVRVAGVVGDDENGRLTTRLLDEVGIDCDGVLSDPARPTTLKERFLGHANKGPWQQLLRVDRESRSSMPAGLQARLLDRVLRGLKPCDALLVADHDKGVCGTESLAEVIDACRRHGVPILVDPGRGKDMTVYRGADLLLPNRIEASVFVGRRLQSVADALQAAHIIIRRTGVPGVLVKLDSDGMVLAVTGQPDRVFAAQNRNPIDVTGAGDMVLAVMGLCRACGIPWHEAAELASVAAGLEVGKMGASPVTLEELREALAARSRERHPSAAPPSRSREGEKETLLSPLSASGRGLGGEVASGRGSEGGVASTPPKKQVTLAEMAELAASYREQGRSVVLTNGCFDLLHAGHAGYLQEAASLGDVLVVAINDDAGIRPMALEFSLVQPKNKDLRRIVTKK